MLAALPPIGECNAPVRIPSSATVSRQLMRDLGKLSQDEWANPFGLIMPVVSAPVQIETKFDERTAQ